MSAAAQPLDPASRRAHQRYRVGRAALLHQDGYGLPVSVRDISGGGAQLIVDSVVRSGIRNTPMRLEIPGIGLFPAERRWSSIDRMGVAFRLSALAQQQLDSKLTRLCAEQWLSLAD